MFASYDLQDLTDHERMEIALFAVRERVIDDTRIALNNFDLDEVEFLDDADLLDLDCIVSMSEIEQTDFDTVPRSLTFD